jgi:hypothetical protein
MQTIFDDRILELWTPGPWSRGTGNLARVQRSQLLQQFRLLTLAENAREETLKESLGGFRFAAFVQHDKSRHGAEMRDQSLSALSTSSTEASAKPAPPRSRRTIAGAAHIGPSDATE